MSEYAYYAEAFLNDGTFKVLDLEAKGWADKALLAKIVRWSLLPKKEAPHLPIVVVNIPEGGKPIFNSRVIRQLNISSGKNLIDIRLYRIGYRKGKTNHWTWILPNGSIESGTGDDSWLADVHVAALKSAAALAGLVQEGGVDAAAEA